MATMTAGIVMTRSTGGSAVTLTAPTVRPKTGDALDRGYARSRVLQNAFGRTPGMNDLITDRLVIRRMSAADAAFMLGLLNEPSWLRFIGDRGVRTLEDARNYILQGPVAMYERLGHGFCIVETRASGEAIGICGLAKRDYLDSADIGFALLPQHCGRGYAFEAAAAVLHHARTALGLKRVLATTRLDNMDSQKLLEKLGLRFERLIVHPDGDRGLKLYAVGGP